MSPWFGIILLCLSLVTRFCVRPVQQGLLVLNNRIFLLLLAQAQRTDGLAPPTPEPLAACFPVE